MRLLATVVAALSVALGLGCETDAPVEREATAGVLQAGGSVDSATTQFLKEIRALRDTSPADYDTLQTALVVTLQMTLGRLGFGLAPFTGVLDEGTRGAVRRFEKTRGLPMTGDLLSPQTFQRLSADQGRLDQEERSMPPAMTAFGDHQWNGGYFFASGPWVMDGERTQEAIHVECYSARRECLLSYARVNRMTRSLEADLVRYEVAWWDHAEITSRPLDYPCARYILRINRVQKSVTLTRSTLSQDGMCSHMEGADLVTRLGEWKELSERGVKESRAVADSLYQLGPKARSMMLPRH